MGQDFYGEILLDSVRFKLAAPLQVNQLASFQGKVVFGDYNQDTNQILSSWVISDLSGGHGVVNLREGTDQNRYRFGTLYTRHPEQTSLPRAVTEMHIDSQPTESWVPVGDFIESGTTRFFSVFAGELYRWDESSGTWSSSLGTLTRTPVNKGVAFEGTGGFYRLYMPMGSDGYAIWGGGGPSLTNVAADGTHPEALAFCVWADRIVAIDVDGQLWYSLSGVNWTSYGSTGKLNRGWIPRGLVVGRDRSDNPCIHVITDRDVFAFDPAGPTLYQTDLFSPATPYSGLGSAFWRGSLYVSSSMGVMQYTGASINPMGLDRDDGLPYSYRGHIVDMESEYNGLYALVTSHDLTTPSRSLNVFTGFGWIAEWDDVGEEFSAANRVPTWIKVSNAQGASRLWWGVGEFIETMKLPTDYANPRALTDDAAGDFAADGDTYYLETGYFDAAMKGYVKIASHLSATISGDMTDSTVKFFYRVDDAVSWTQVGSTITAVGDYVLTFGTPTNGISPGIPFHKIELRWEIEKSAGGTTSPLIESVTLGFLKVVKSVFNWTAQIDLSSTHQDKSTDNLSAKLDELIAADHFFTFVHYGTTYRVRLAQYGGRDNLGHDKRRTRTVSILEVPEGF